MFALNIVQGIDINAIIKLFHVFVGPAGAHEVVLIAGPNGKARYEADPIEFTYVFGVDDINPTEGSLGGEQSLILISRRLQDIVLFKMFSQCLFANKRLIIMLRTSKFGAAT